MNILQRFQHPDNNYFCAADFVALEIFALIRILLQRAKSQINEYFSSSNSMFQAIKLDGVSIATGLLLLFRGPSK
ncbi:hypothetical protein ACFL4X_00425 [Gemmatimonadota bacterium]